MKFLFICRENIGRSQMATAFFNKLSKNNYAVGAGTHVEEKEGKNLPKLILKCMTELSYDLSKNTRKQVTPEIVKEADKIVVMTEKELSDYIINSGKTIYWNVEDAKGKSYEFHCETRDQIKSLVEKLVEEIG